MDNILATKKITVIVDEEDKTTTFQFDAVIKDEWEAKYEEPEEFPLFYSHKVIFPEPKLEKLILRFLPLANQNGHWAHITVKDKTKNGECNS